MSKVKRVLFVIDPQYDFSNPSGSLFVNGADRDMSVLSNFIKKHKHAFDRLVVSLDSHHPLHVAHSIMWIDKKGNHPDPFTVITNQDVKDGNFKASFSPYQSILEDYVNQLEANNRYNLMIWPQHCIIGTPGYCVDSKLLESIHEWEISKMIPPQYYTKGSNIFSEHYSVLQADVPRADDPGTMLNKEFLMFLENFDEVMITGEAADFCVAFTLIDIISNFSKENIKKIHIIEDTTSAVGSGKKSKEEFLKEFESAGANIIKTDNF